MGASRRAEARGVRADEARAGARAGGSVAGRASRAAAKQGAAALRLAGRGRFEEGLEHALRARLQHFLSRSSHYVEAGDLVNASVFARRVARLSLEAWARARGLPQDNLDRATRTLDRIEALWVGLMGEDLDD